MSKSKTADSESQFEGNMFLYDSPALLTREAHGNMGLSQARHPFEFARPVKALPLVANEIQTAQKHYPVIFSDYENPALLAIVGVVESSNLFVTDDGQWEPGSYVPSYARCHPFALAARDDDEFAVIIDESSQFISETPEIPFFENEQLSATIQARVDLCGHFREGQRQTQTFCQRIKDLGLLNGQRVNQTLSDGSEEKIADYVAIDTTKLNDLDKDTLQELHQDGSLAAIFAMIFSLENWNHLILRRNRKLGLK